MNLFKRLFGVKPLPPASGGSQYDDSGHEPAPSSRSVPRREVVHVVLRDTMRRHGIPSDWIECRTSSQVQSGKSTGTYVTLIVKHGQDRLLAYVPAFQVSFREALERFDPRASEWLRGLAWQFESDKWEAESRPMPEPEAWRGAQPKPAANSKRKPSSNPNPNPAVAPPAIAREDEDLQSDLKALFAIRDAAISGSDLTSDGFKPTERGGL